MLNNNFDNELKIGQLPELKIVSIGDLIFHEEPDQERLISLVNRIGTDAILKNPPIVARMKNGNPYALLDGANRTTALIKLGFQHILVQVVDIDDPLLSLHCWHHAIEELDKTYFSNKLDALDGIKVVEREPFNSSGGQRQNLSGSNNYLCRMIFRDRSVIAVMCERSLPERLEILKTIASYYLKTALSDRVSYIDLDDLMTHYRRFETLITFRRFSKGDFEEIIKTGIKLPAGVTRVFLPKRALGLNIRLDFLKSDLTIREKNDWLGEMIIKKVREKSIRFYKEPTFVFDE